MDHGPKREILAALNLVESPALSLAPRVYQISFSEQHLMWGPDTLKGNENGRGS